MISKGHTRTHPLWIEARVDSLADRDRDNWIGKLLKMEPAGGGEAIFRQVDFVTDQGGGVWRIHLIPIVEPD